jgi:hypothetical protein
VSSHSSLIPDSGPSAALRIVAASARIPVSPSAAQPADRHAAASKHKALSRAHANKIKAQLRQEVQTLLALAEKADRASVPDGMDDRPANQARQCLIRRSGNRTCAGRGVGW